jgi:hypothetical protein
MNCRQKVASNWNDQEHLKLITNRNYWELVDSESKIEHHVASELNDSQIGHGRWTFRPEVGTVPGGRTNAVEPFPSPGEIGFTVLRKYRKLTIERMRSVPLGRKTGRFGAFFVYKLGIDIVP